MADLLKKIDEFLHDDYILTFPEMKLEQEKFDKYLNEKKDNGCLDEKIKEYLSFNEITFRDKYEKGDLNINDIFNILNRVKLDEEIDGDLWQENEAYLCLYKVYDNYFTYLLKR